MRLGRLVITLLTAVVTVAALLTAPAPAAAVGPVQLGNASHAVKGCNVRRTPGALVIYTRAWGTSTRTNRHGFEAAVVRGKVVRVAGGRGNMRIPRRGVVLSGRGASRTWLRNNAWVGQRAVIPRCRRRPPTPPPPPAELLPDLGMREITDVSLDTTSTPGTSKLRFTTVIVNVGQGPLELLGERDDTESEMTTQQRIFSADGSSRMRDTPARMYYAGDGHTHWHVRDLATYDLVLTSTEEQIGTQEKHGFCFADNSQYTSTTDEYYETCGRDPEVLTQTMGLSPGWADTYLAKLADQYIDVTDLPEGTYRMRLTADADNWFTESDEDNNGNWADLEITSDSATVVDTGGDLF